MIFGEFCGIIDIEKFRVDMEFVLTNIRDCVIIILTIFMEKYSSGRRGVTRNHVVFSKN